MGELTGRSGAAGNETVEDSAVVIAEEDAVDFWAHSEPSRSEDAATRCGTSTIPGKRNAVNLPCQTSRAVRETPSCGGRALGEGAGYRNRAVYEPPLRHGIALHSTTKIWRKSMTGFSPSLPQYSGH